MFMQAQDLVLPEGQIVPLAGGMGFRRPPIGYRRYGRRGSWRRREARRQPLFAARKLSGMGQIANPQAAEAVVLTQKIMAAKRRANVAKKIADQVMHSVAQKAKANGMGIWNPFSAASDWIADNVVTPVAEYVGNETYAYIPTEEEIAQTEENVQKLKENIESREEAHKQAVASGDPAQIEANPPVPSSSQTAAKIGEETVETMKDARKKILDPLGELGRIWKKAKWYVIGGTGLIGALIAWPYISALRASGVAAKRAMS